jgi:hypothetical protein
MALYDDAKIMFLASAAARTDTKDFSKIQCVKPVEAVSSTDLVINGDFSIDGPGTDGALTTAFGIYKRPRGDNYDQKRSTKTYKRIRGCGL